MIITYQRKKIYYNSILILKRFMRNNDMRNSCLNLKCNKRVPTVVKNNRKDNNI